MRKNRSLWFSLVFVTALALASTVGLVMGSLEPKLGLDLRGGVAVILSAPDGTPPDVMEQALDNIRRRVDAFGVGEPDIFLSGTTIEVQVPGEANSTIEQAEADVYCIVSAEGKNLGCSNEQQNVEDVVAGLEPVSQIAEACLITGEEELDCFGSKQEAEAAEFGITVEPKAGPTPSATVSPTGSPTASPTVGPGGAADQYCLTDISNEELACYDTAAEAREAQEAIEITVTERTWCLIPQSPEPTATPTPTPTPTETATPTASPEPDAAALYSQLDLSTAEQLPCDLDSREEAEDELDAITVDHVTTRFCVMSPEGEDLGCYIDRATAGERQRETGQRRLIEVIGQTARLEERATLQIITPEDPAYATLPVTCATEEEQASERCRTDELDDEEVVYFDLAGNKVRLGPVIITGRNITDSFAGRVGGTPENPISEWAVSFQLDGEGTTRFAEATRQALAMPPPQDQIAIAMDHVIISNPTVQGEIAGGNGQITGNFTQESAQDLATQLNAGQLPVELTRQSVRTVSPTLGEESLEQGILAGLAGLALLFVYLLVYYRLLGVVAWFGMAIWAVFAFALVSLAGSELGYALTLAGVAGLVISLGVTADSYIVFFERLKDELRGGKSPRTVVRPAFKRAFRTIVAADIVTIIAAGVLYVTAVSSVRGFALTLGVATGLDMFVVYFFKRPTVILVAQSKRLVSMRGFGLTSAAAADHAASGPFPEGQP